MMGPFGGICFYEGFLTAHQASTDYDNGEYNESLSEAMIAWLVMGVFLTFIALTVWKTAHTYDVLLKRMAGIQTETADEAPEGVQFKSLQQA
eukprot:COSAG01_NODE_38615_length_487_cov_1.118557_1_plen_91_part_01